VPRDHTRGLVLSLFAFAAGVASVIALSASTALAQSPNLDVTWALDGYDLTVGDPFYLTITANHPDGYHVIFPDLPEDWEGFEVRGQTPVPTVTQPDRTQTSAQTYEMALFLPGDHQTPEIPVTFRAPDGQLFEEEVPQRIIQINSILQDGDEELRDIRPQSDIAVPSLLPWGVGGLAALVLLALATFLLWRRFRPESALPMATAPVRTPFEVAMAQLDHIEALDLVAQGRFKEHFTLISETIRAYLLGEFDVPAPDLTTTEASIALRSADVSTVAALEAVAILQSCDIVKFTKLTPQAGPSLEAVNKARVAIEEMRPTPPPPEPLDLEPAKAASA